MAKASDDTENKLANYVESTEMAVTTDANDDDRDSKMDTSDAKETNDTNKTDDNKNGEEPPKKKANDELFDDFNNDNREYFMRSDAQELSIRLRIDNLTEIDTVMQRYAIKGAVYKQWKMTETDVKNWDNSKLEYIYVEKQQWNSVKGEFQTVTVKETPPPYEPETKPDLLFINCIEMESSEYQMFGKTIYRQMKNKKTGEPYNAMVLNFKGWFTEEFEVQNFPFDVQDLSICLVGLFGAHKRLIAPSRCTFDTIQIDRTFNSITDWEIAAVDSQNWLIDFLEATTRGKKKGGLSDTNNYCQFRIQVQRKWFIYFSRVILWLFALGFVTFGMFCFTPDNIEGRLNYAITLVLTIVALQFVISSELPKVAYFTFLDKYNFFIFGFIFSTVVESMLVGYHESGIFEDNKKVDNTFAFILAGLYGVGNLLFILLAWRAYKVERRKLGHWDPLKRDVCSYHVWNYDYKDSKFCNNDPNDEIEPERLY